MRSWRVRLSTWIVWIQIPGPTELEVDKSSLGIGFKHMHEVSRIKSPLASLVELRSRMPDYLFESANA
jgi:hypothetical protein